MEFCKFILFVSYLLFQVLAKSDLALPIITIFRIDSKGKPLIVLKSTNNETTAGLNHRLWFKCTATYPIQWIYLGNGAPQFVTTASGGRTANTYQADLRIEKTIERHTGKYKCRSTHFPDVESYSYLYLPGPEIFTAAEGKHILFSQNDTTITIPCTVSQKDAIVNLQKSIEDILQGPINTRGPYNPRLGFRLRLSDLEDPVGIYVCSAAYRNIFRLMEYTVLPKDSVNRADLKCTTSTCGRNARCQLLGSIVSCSCLESFRGNPYSYCEKPCLKNTDCPVNLFCNSTMKTCEDPCKGYSCDYSVSECKVISHSPGCVQNTRVKEIACGKIPACPSGTQCEVIRGQHKCECAKNFLGNNPEIGCYASCQNSVDCSSVKSCDYPICVDPCTKFNSCGVNANCLVQKHNRVCECKQGYTGEPYQICHKIGDKLIRTTTTVKPRAQVMRGNISTTPASSYTICQQCGPQSSCNLINGKIFCSCKSGYLGRPPKCRPSCTRSESCPAKSACIRGRCIDPCGQNQVCGRNSECTVDNHRPICICEKGFDGNPYGDGCVNGRDFGRPHELSPRCSAEICSRKRNKV